jgi:Tfp pilus assembly pilus retraction ATPase PilT
MAGMYCVEDLVRLASREGAEEVRLQAGRSPVLFLRGEAHPLELATLTGDEIAQLFRSFATADQVDELHRCGDVRFNHTFQGSSRFGVTALMDGPDIMLTLKNLGR